jgi:segregation and condensation protein B
MSLKAQVEALIYAADEPISLEQLATLLREAVLAELAATRERGHSHAPCMESTLLPELDSTSEELNGLEPGPLMPPQDAEPVEELEIVSEVDVFRDGDEPLFATQCAEVTAANVPAAVQAEAALALSAEVAAPESTSRKRQPKKSEAEIAQDKAVRARLREVLIDLAADYASEERGMEIRQVAGGYRMATKPQHHDLVRAFSKSLKPPTRLSLAALETLAVVAYKQPITAPEIADIRGVESGSVLGTLLDRKLITTAGRKQVIGRPMQYKTSREFLLRFGLNDLNELPSMEEFSQLALDSAIEVGGGESPAEPQPQAAEHATASAQYAGAESAEHGGDVEAEDSAESDGTSNQ